MAAIISIVFSSDSTVPFTLDLRFGSKAPEHGRSDKYSYGPMIPLSVAVGVACSCTRARATAAATRRTAASWPRTRARRASWQGVRLQVHAMHMYTLLHMRVYACMHVRLYVRMHVLEALFGTGTSRLAPKLSTDGSTGTREASRSRMLRASTSDTYK